MLFCVNTPLTGLFVEFPGELSSVLEISKGKISGRIFVNGNGQEMDSSVINSQGNEGRGKS